MRAKLVVYRNSDDAMLLWTVDRVDPACLGFAVQRRLGPRGAHGDPEWLPNFAPPGPLAHQAARMQSSESWPFRRFSWTDHTVDPGDVVSYRVVPVLAAAPAVREDLATSWSSPKRVGTSAGNTFRAFFNRGFVMSQFVSRYLDQHFAGMTREEALKAFKAGLNANAEDTFRGFLSGQVRTELLGLLDDAAQRQVDVFAALFELSDPELVPALQKLGARAHLVLANGSIEAKKNETSEQARHRDENERARGALLTAGVDVETTHRFVSPGALAHNKFLVVTDAGSKPAVVWTGSTNWTATGLCTQLNNGLLIKNRAVSQLYLDQWHALRAVGSTHPAALAAANSRPITVTARLGKTRSVGVQFTRTQDRVDLTDLHDLVLSAQEGVLFLMFMPGNSGVLADVRTLARDKPDLLVRGVVSQLPNGRADETTGDTTTVRVSLTGMPGAATSFTFDAVQPQGMDHPAAGWAIETTRKQFMGGIGHAIIHSKVLVIDPFTATPTVVTGSHNFSLSASTKNDENFVVIRGDRELAEAYAVNIETAWRHYAARARRPDPGVSGVRYLESLLAEQRPSERFWHLT